MKHTTIVAPTSKGHRIFIEGLNSSGLVPTGQRYNVAYYHDSIVVQWDTEGRRAVVKSKGGVIDLESKRITQWANGAATVAIEYTANSIVITRV